MSIPTDGALLSFQYCTSFGNAFAQLSPPWEFTLSIDQVKGFRGYKHFVTVRGYDNSIDWEYELTTPVEYDAQSRVVKVQCQSGSYAQIDAESLARQYVEALCERRDFWVRQRNQER